jgi:glycosyltransferase involved in cell wall biosynthesis
MENKINLVHINSYFLTNKLHEELVLSLQDMNSSIHQTVYIPINKKDKITWNYCESINILYIISKAFSNLERYFWPLKMLSIYKDFNKKTKNHKITITHAHSLISNGIISFFLYKKRAIPYIVTVRNTDINIFMKKSVFFRKIGYEILDNAESIMVLSPAYKNIQIRECLTKFQFEQLKDKIKIIPNGVNDFWIKNRYLNESRSSNCLEILFVGKLRENKNCSALIKACKLLEEKGLDFQLTIVGEGYLKEKLQEEAKGLKVRFLGFISDNEQLLKVYRESNLLVVPSFKESFGLVYVEAMTQGLPIIYTKGQGFDGNFEEGVVGFSVMPNEYEKIAEAIQKINENYIEISKNAYNYALNFSWTTNSKLLNDIYTKIE